MIFNEREKFKHVSFYKDSREKKRNNGSCKRLILCENNKTDSLSSSIIKIFKGKIVDASDYQNSNKDLYSEILFG